MPCFPCVQDWDIGGADVMAGRGPAPKPTSRRSRTRGRVLSVVDEVATPPLPDTAGVAWHPMTEAWWDDIWASPMAPEWAPSDRHGLYLLAMLVNAYWTAPTSQLAAEIRLQRQCFGLTPVDRQRLRWELERGEEAAVATERRRSATALRGAKRATTKTDPRDVLKG